MPHRRMLGRDAGKVGVWLALQRAQRGHQLGQREPLGEERAGPVAEPKETAD